MLPAAVENSPPPEEQRNGTARNDEPRRLGKSTAVAKNRAGGQQRARLSLLSDSRIPDLVDADAYRKPRRRAHARGVRAGSNYVRECVPRDGRVRSYVDGAYLRLHFDSGLRMADEIRS